MLSIWTWMGQNILQNNYKLAKALNQQINTYELVYVYASTMDKVRDLIELIKDYGFEAYSQTEWIEGLLTAKKPAGTIGGYWINIFGSIGYRYCQYNDDGVLERRREIGIMKVIGFLLKRYVFIFSGSSHDWLLGRDGRDAVFSFICIYIKHQS